MANIPIYDGNPIFISGSITPFGFYDADSDFQTDAVKVAKFCALRLGYPIENVELQSGSFFTAFEEAVTVYGNELYAYKVRDNMLSLEGASTGSNLNHAQITPTMASIVRLSEQYGEEAGVGGNVTWYSGSVAMTASVQDYDLGQWAIDNNITGGIEIKKVFYEEVPAINELYDLQTIQAIEMSNQVRQANYSFQLINNILRIFPVPDQFDIDPDTGYRPYLWFQYIKKDDRINSAIDNSMNDKITNESNVPYGNPTYTQINSIGRSWIFEYTLALAKEMLGYVRGKYSTVPIPGAEVTLNQGDLISAATAEKEALITRLREYFDSTSRQALLERRAAESVARKSELGEVPMTIYIG